MERKLNLNIHSLGKSGCTPHLVHFQKTSSAVLDYLVQDIPIQVSFVHQLCPGSFSQSAKCIANHAKMKTKFLKCFPHRFSYRCCCHAFLLLWPDLESNDELLSTLRYLGQFSRISTKEYIYNRVVFPVSYLGEMYFIFFLNFATTNIDKIQNILTIPDQTFLKDLTTGLTLGWRLHKTFKKYAIRFQSLGNELLSRPVLDNFLSRRDRIKEVQLYDDEIPIEDGFNSKPLKGLYFEFNRQKSFVFSSLILSRMPNITIRKLKGVAQMFQNHKWYLVLRFTSFEERNSLEINKDEDFFSPRGIGRIKGALIFRERAYYNFLTCDGAQEHLSLYWMLVPFDCATWIFLCIGIFLLVLSFNILFKSFRENFTLLVYGYLLEQPYEIKRLLIANTSFRVVLGPFLMSIIIITNCYKGIFVTDLTAPRVFSGINSLDELSTKNFTIYSNPKVEKRMLLFYVKVNFFGTKYVSSLYADTFESRRATIGMTWENETIFDSFERNPGWKNSFIKFPYSELILKRIIKKVDDAIVRTGVLLTKFLGVTVGFPHVSFQKKISECKKTAFLDLNSQLHRFYRPKKWKNLVPKRMLYHGKQPGRGLSKLKLIEFFGGFVHLIDFLRKELNVYIQSGIYEQWEKYLTKSTQNNLFRNELAKPFLKGHQRSLNFQNSQILGVFWIYLSSCSICSIVFICELAANAVCIHFFQLVKLLGKITHKSR